MTTARVHELEAETRLLRRRVARERDARLQAEAIAERGLRDLYDKQQQLQLLEAIAAAANKAISVTEALQFTVSRVCTFTGWQVGHAYLAEQDDGGQRLVPTSVWHGVEAESLCDFYRATEAICFRSGVGLPGRVLASAAPAWLTDVTVARNFQRATAAQRAGLKAALAFPVLLDTDVVAVVEFFADRVLEPDQTLLHLMAQIGTQLARVVERQRAADQLTHDAFHDALTELPNRALFTDRLARAMARTTRRPELSFAVLFIDLDRFKLVNDSLGHHAGDLLIGQVTQRLKGCLRDEDTLARIGGDEFTILLDSIDELSNAILVAEGILRVFEAPFLISGKELHISASIGVAVSTSGYGSAAEVLREADLAMYRAKTLGKGRYEVYDHTMHEQAMRRLTLENNLRSALRNNEFVLHYQPIVALSSWEVVGIEALIRWRKSETELVYPAKFIDVAEDTGIILPIGIWVLQEACTMTARWHAAFPRESPLTVSVNISARQFSQADFVQQVAAIIDETGIAPASLRLEITESVAMIDSDRMVDVFEQLRALGVLISIDDFGTGYSSLSYLHRLPLDVLKIDRSFIAQLGHGKEGAQIVQTIVNLARNLGIEVIAEGTETEEHIASLKSLGCNFAQGYYFSKPLDSAALTTLLKEASTRWQVAPFG